MTEELVCPITLEPFKDPVFLVQDGFTYESDALVQWFCSGKRHTPMGFSISGHTYCSFKNLALRKSNPFICPITQEEMKDPIIIKETGLSYEHDALISSIKQTICKGKHLNLFYSLSKVTMYKNKALWKPEYSEYRKPIVMPPLKKYAGFNIRLTPNVPQRYHKVCEALELYKEERILNTIFNECYFTGGCFKGLKFINCRFRKCMFNGCCFCCIFKNCDVFKCAFMTPHMRDGFRCPGSTFRECVMTLDGEIHYHGNKDSTAVICQSADAVLSTFKFKRAKKMDITFYAKK